MGSDAFFPKFKKSVKSFFLDCSGSISKKSLLNMGLVSVAFGILSANKDVLAGECHRNFTWVDRCMNNTEWVNPSGDILTNTAYLEARAHANNHDSHGAAHTNCFTHANTPDPKPSCIMDTHSNELKLNKVDSAIVATHSHEINTINDFNIEVNAHCNDAGGHVSCGSDKGFDDSGHSNSS